MKKIVIIAAVFACILVLTKIANQIPPDPLPGTTFALKAQRIVQCSPTEITLVDSHMKATHLMKDESWPECPVFQADDVLDFYLARGSRTKLLNYEKTAWWRKTF